MEQRQGDPHVVRTLFRRGLAISPRSRYTYLVRPPLALPSELLFARAPGHSCRRRRSTQGSPTSAGSGSGYAHECGPGRAPHIPAAALQAWALWEKEQGNLEEARRLLREGSARNPRDAALLQVGRQSSLTLVGAC